MRLTLRAVQYAHKRCKGLCGCPNYSCGCPNYSNAPSGCAGEESQLVVRSAPIEIDDAAVNDAVYQIVELVDKNSPLTLQDGGEFLVRECPRSVCLSCLLEG